MPSAFRDAVRAALREAGPLSLDEVAARLVAQGALASKNPRQTVYNVVANDRLCQRADDGRYVYLPAAVRGASVRIPLELTAPDKGLAVVPVEAFALLWPTASAWGEAGPAPRVALEGGPEIALEQEHRAWTSGLRVVLDLPAPFWAWWAARRSAGADAVRLRCVDGEAGRYLGAALRTADLGAEAVAARNEQVRAAAVELLGRSRAGLRADDLAWRLLARGVYHADPTPIPSASSSSIRPVHSP